MNKSKSRVLLIIIVSLVIFLGMFSQFALRPVDHDEHMYIYAGVLIQNYQLYTDFAHLQMPYLPILYGFIFKVTGNTNFLFWGRLPGLIAIAAAALLLLLIVYRQTHDIYLGLGGLVLFAFCHPVMLIMPYAWNHVIPLALSLLAFYLTIKSLNGEKPNFWYLLLSGISLAIAAGMKLTYAVMPLPFIIVMIFFPGSLSFRRRIKRSVFPFCLGILIGALPLLYIFFRTPTDIFIFDNIGYHQANALWRSLTGWDTGITVAGKIEFIWRELAYPSNLALLLATLFVVAYAVWKELSPKVKLRQFMEIDSVLCLLIIISTVIVSITPKPLLVTYFAMPVPYIIIFIAITYSRLQIADRLPFRVLFLCLIFISGIYGGVRLFRYLPQLPFPDRWAFSYVLDVGGEISRYDDLIGKDGKIATLAPLYVLEAGHPGYLEFSTGSFLYRVGDLLTAGERERYKGVSPKSLAAFLDNDPPAAILVGYEGILDEPFIDYARNNGYVPVELKSTRGTLYIRDKSMQGED